jgi:hypothetical protein
METARIDARAVAALAAEAPRWGGEVAAQAGEA